MVLYSTNYVINIPKDLMLCPISTVPQSSSKLVSKVICRLHPGAQAALLRATIVISFKSLFDSRCP
jgi:hypothetical protein